VFGGLATIYGPVTAVFVLYPLEWLGSFSAFGVCGVPLQSPARQ
jgi:hypothetical protein